MRFGQNLVGRPFRRVSVRFPMTDVKKNLCRYGEIEISNSHPFSDKVNGFKISPYMQDKMVFIGCQIYIKLMNCQLISKLLTKFF